MKLGKNLGKIADYGLSKSKAGNATVFVKIIDEDGSTGTWYGSPFKKDGEINDLCFQQLVYCGFDPEKHSIDDLANGFYSGVLDIDAQIEYYAAMKTMGDGSQGLQISSLGEMGPMRISQEEVSSIITDEQRNKVKALAGKFKPRKKPTVVQQNPDDPIPF